MQTADMTTPPGASAHEGVPSADAGSPLGEWRDAAPAVRYSAKAIIEPGGHIHTDGSYNGTRARAIPASTMCIEQTS